MKKLLNILNEGIDFVIKDSLFFILIISMVFLFVDIIWRDTPTEFILIFFDYYNYFIIGFIIFLLFSNYSYKKRLSELKNKYLKKDYNKYLEYEYQNERFDFFSGITYFINIFISICAIGFSMIIASLKLELNGLAEKLSTNNMSESFGAFLGAFLVLYFFTYYIYGIYKKDRKNIIREKLFSLKKTKK